MICIATSGAYSRVSKALVNAALCTQPISEWHEFFVRVHASLIVFLPAFFPSVFGASCQLERLTKRPALLPCTGTRIRPEIRRGRINALSNTYGSGSPALARRTTRGSGAAGRTLHWPLRNWVRLPNVDTTHLENVVQ